MFVQGCAEGVFLCQWTSVPDSARGRAADGQKRPVSGQSRGLCQKGHRPANTAGEVHARAETIKGIFCGGHIECSCTNECRPPVEQFQLFRCPAAGCKQVVVAHSNQESTSSPMWTCVLTWRRYWTSHMLMFDQQLVQVHMYVYASVHKCIRCKHLQLAQTQLHQSLTVHVDAFPQGFRQYISLPIFGTPDFVAKDIFNQLAVTFRSCQQEQSGRERPHVP